MPIGTSFGEVRMHFIRLTIIILAVSIAGAANATIWVFNDLVDATQVVPPTGSPAVGTAVGTYDEATNMLVINVAVNGFGYAPNAAHIHGPALPGSNTGVLFNLGVGGTAVNYTNPNTNWTMPGAYEIDFLNGLYYVQIHTAFNPGGAVRGQLNPVPEPASLIALGIGALVLARRRRRKA